MGHKGRENSLAARVSAAGYAAHGASLDAAAAAAAAPVRCRKAKRSGEKHVVKGRGNEVAAGREAQRQQQQVQGTKTAL